MKICIVYVCVYMCMCECVCMWEREKYLSVSGKVQGKTKKITLLVFRVMLLYSDNDRDDVLSHFSQHILLFTT